MIFTFIVHKSPLIKKSHAQFQTCTGWLPKLLLMPNKHEMLKSDCESFFVDGNSDFISPIILSREYSVHKIKAPYLGKLWGIGEVTKEKAKHTLIISMHWDNNWSKIENIGKRANEKGWRSEEKYTMLWNRLHCRKERIPFLMLSVNQVHRNN